MSSRIVSTLVPRKPISSLTNYIQFQRSTSSGSGSYIPHWQRISGTLATRGLHTTSSTAYRARGVASLDLPFLQHSLCFKHNTVSQLGQHFRPIPSTSQTRPFTMSTTKKSSQDPTIDRIETLNSSDAKWSKLQNIHWTDQTGRQRVWEACSRSTRGSSGVDAVAIVPVLLHPSRPASTILITQFRPPVGKFCVEFPAGLVDEGESVEDAALRELKEETGYEGRILEVSPVSSLIVFVFLRFLFPGMISRW